MTNSGAVPDLVKPIGLIRKKFPSTLTGKVDFLRKKKKRLLKNFSKYFSPPLPPTV